MPLPYGNTLTLIFLVSVPLITEAMVPSPPHIIISVISELIRATMELISSRLVTDIISGDNSLISVLRRPFDLQRENQFPEEAFIKRQKALFRNSVKVFYLDEELPILTSFDVNSIYDRINRNFTIYIRRSEFFTLFKFNRHLYSEWIDH